MKKILMMLFLVVSVMTLTTSCGDDFDYDQDTEVANSMIVGTWRDVDLSDGAEYWTFNSDGTAISALMILRYRAISRSISHIPLQIHA